jgi:peptidyl-prolyl cis-trans isomerase B (cyclophilin B)
MSNTRRPGSSAAPGKQSSSQLTSVVVAAVALLCVVAVIAIALLLRGHGTPAAGAASPSSTVPAPATSEAAPTTSASAPSTLDCKTAPSPVAEPQSFKSPPKASLAQHATWDATIATNCGDIRMRLDGKRAPQTVASFIFLAQKGFFDDSPCHRMTTRGIFVLQCGDPTGSGSGGPGYGFGIENAPKTGQFPAGAVGMARSTSPTSNGSQFFVVYKNSTLPTQGGGYSIFGKVTKGLGIVQALAKAGVSGGASDGPPAQPISILSVTVKEA